MDTQLRHLLVIPIALVALCGLTLAFGAATPGYAGGPQATPTCECTGGGELDEDVTDTSSVVGYVYDFSTGPPVPVKGMGVTLSGCSWNTAWGTDDNGYFFFNNLGAGLAHVNLELPPDGHAINPNVVVNTSGLTDTYTVYLGFYLGDKPPVDSYTTPDGKPLTAVSAQTVTWEPTTTPDGALISDVGGTLPDSYLVIAMSAVLLVLLPMAGFKELVRQHTYLE
jgi:hypothetical protein